MASRQGMLDLISKTKQSNPLTEYKKKKVAEKIKSSGMSITKTNKQAEKVLKSRLVDSNGKTEKRKKAAPPVKIISPTDIWGKAVSPDDKQTTAKTGTIPVEGTSQNTRDANLWDATIGSVVKGYYEARHGQESYKAALGQANKKAYYEEKLNSDKYAFTPDSEFESVVSEAAKIVGQLIRQSTDARALGSAAIGAGAALAAGQMGPQVLVPEEIATVPGAAIVGFKAGSAMSNLEIEAGHAYNEMVENGISHKTAAAIATAVGAGNAALEAIQLDDLIKGYKVMSKLDNADNFLKKLGEYLIKKGAHVASETGQEVLQEANTLVGVDIARMIEGKDKIYSGKEVLNRLGDTAASSAASFALLGVGGDAVIHGVKGGSNIINKHGKNKEAVDNKTDAKSKLSVNTESAKAMLSDLNTARKSFLEYTKKHFPQSVLNVNTEKRIGISRKGIDKFLSGNISKEKFSTGYKIPELLSTAYKVGEAENLKPKSGINGYEYYENNILIDGKDYKAHIRVKNTDMGDKYYGHTISKFVDEIKIEPLARSSEEISTGHLVNASGSNNSLSQNSKTVNKNSVSVGDTFKDRKTGNTITVVERDAKNTTVEISTGEKTETREFTNSQADTLAANEQFEQMESSDVLSPEDAQKYNIVVSNLKRKAEELGLLDSNFFTALQNVNLYNPTTSDRAVINSEFRRVFAGNTDPLIAGWLNGISVGAQSVTNINEQNMPVNTKNTTVTNADVAKEDNLLEAFRRDEDGKIRFNQIDIDYSNTAMRKGQFKTVNVGWESKAVDGFLCGKYGINKNGRTGKYVVTLLQSGMIVKTFDKITEAKKVATYLDDNLSFNDVSYVKRAGNNFVLEQTDELKAYLSEAKRILDNKEYETSAPVDAEIQDGKVPFHTKAELVEYVKAHRGDSVRVTFDNGISEIRTLEGISNTNLRTKKPDSSASNAELKGIKYNDTGFSIDYSTGVSATFDFVNVGDNSTADITKPLKENVNRDKMETSSDTKKESEATENADIKEYDSIGETQLRKAEKEGLHRRGNQADVVGNQEYTDRSQGGTYPNNEEKYNGEPASKGLVRGLFHGTPYQFSRHAKSYVDLAIHFGTEEQAKSRIPGGKGNINQADLILNNPLITEDIFGERTPKQYMNALVEKSELSESEKNTLKKLFEDFSATDITPLTTTSLKQKLSAGSHRIITKPDKDGIYVSLAVVDDASKTNEIPLTELIDKNKLVEIIGLDETVAVIKNGRISENANGLLAPYLFEAVLPFEKQYLQLRKIEESLQSFGYDGFAYKNENEGRGWSYAVFDDSQIIRADANKESVNKEGTTKDNLKALAEESEDVPTTAIPSVSQDNDTVSSSIRTKAENNTSKVSDVAYFEKLGSDIRKGETVSLKDVRTAVDAILLNHGEAIKAELSQLKNDELKKHLSIYDRGRITKKAEMVDSIYTDMLSSLYYALSGKETITYIYDGTGFEAQQSKMLFDISRELTEETFSKRLAENAEKYKKQVAAREEKLAKVKNPQTLEDYAYKKRYFGLSDEETIQYEKLYAEERRKAREDKKTAKTTKDTSSADAFFANADNYTIEKTTHTKTGEDVWVVRPASRLETEQWKQLNEQMKALGGSYWRGNQGWNFKKDPTAALSSTEETEAATVKGSTNAEKLRAVAEGMQKAIDDKFRDRLTNTAKRAREAASAEAEGERLKRLQDTINNIADALENGENTLLDKIDSKAQVETLMSMLRTGRRNRISETLPDITYDERLQEQDKPYSNDDAKYAEYPLTKLHESAITEYIRAAEGKTGYKQITDRLKKSLKSVKNGYVTVDAQMFADIDKIVQNLSTNRADFWNDGVAERKRLARMGIENVVELRAYLREFIKFLPGKDADAERQRNIKAKERQLANAKIEGFFPTPKAIVEKMLDEADIKPGEKVLEPSAGKGNIADAIRENYPGNALDIVEWNASLNELLSEKGYNVVGSDFLQHSGEYDKIIMNPPFEKGQDIDHIRHAYSLLNDGGRVVCIMSEGPFFRSDKKATEFREWLDGLGGVSEKLPEGAFKSSERSTGVNTRLVVIDKAANDTKPAKSKYGVKSSRDTATENSRADRWSTDRVAENTESKSTVSISEIIEQISSEFGIPINTGKVTDREASGIYKEKPETIRTSVSNNLPTISHELGHHLDKKYNLNELSGVESIREIVSEEFLDQYPDNAINGELVAEFVRRYLKNSNEANRLCPEFYNDFVRTLSKEDLAAVNKIAKQINEYLSYDIDKRYESSVISAKKAKKMQKLPFAEKWKNLYTGWIDKFHPLKQITDYVSSIKGDALSGIKDAYVLATNSLNAHTIANYQVLEGFRDLNGNFVDDAKSLIDCIGMVNSKDINTLDLYLKLKHALEVIGKGKRVFADEVLEDTDNIKKRIAEIEKAHPEMVEASNNLYEFQYNMLKHFAVPSGIMAMEQVDYLHHEYPCYVPFYRFIKNKKGGMFAKSSFVNQNSPIMRQTGSGLDTLSHLESIIKNVEKIIKASVRNQTAAVLGSYADNVDGIGQFIEKVTPDMLPHTIDITALKENFANRLQEVIKSSDDFFAISGLMDDVFGDDVTDFTPVANESKKIISVMRGGERSYYQIHDDTLFSAVAELSPQQANGWIRICNAIMQPMKLLITQNNPIFAATNALRDFGTAYKLSEINNIVAFTTQYVKALGGIIANSEDYKKYKAMGGGHSSELSANIENISKTLRRVAQKDMGKARRLAYSIFRHPVDSVASINDAIESIPRFMEFERTLKENGDLQKAIFNASDITTNFKRNGSSNTAKFVNSSIMFNNAAIQGLDKTFRTLTAKNPKKRYATLTKWLLHALIMGVLGYLYNKEVDEEGYKNLSSYKKNNFYNFAIGDGKFISLPKPRENALLDAVTERTIEYLFGDNEEAFYDFGSYLGLQLLPPLLPDTLNPVDAVHSVGGSTIFGGLLDVGFNKDFRGTPIEGAYDKYTPSNERYTESTTKLAYELGQTKLARDLDMSPKKIDHLISSYTGILGQVNKALFPINENRKDTSFGLRNKFVSDSNYSTDVLNRMYENQEKAEKAFNYSGSVGDAVEYEKNSIVTSYISGMNKAVKALPEDEQRNGRAYLLKTLNSWNYEDTASQSNMLSNLADSTVSKDCIFSELPSSTLEWSVNKQKYVYQMTPQEYHKYISDYLTVIENSRRHYGGNTVESYEAAKDAAKDYMSKYKKGILKNQYLSKAIAKTE